MIKLVFVKGLYSSSQHYRIMVTKSSKQTKSLRLKKAFFFLLFLNGASDVEKRYVDKVRPTLLMSFQVKVPSLIKPSMSSATMSPSLSSSLKLTSAGCLS